MLNIWFKQLESIQDLPYIDLEMSFIKTLQLYKTAQHFWGFYFTLNWRWDVTPTDGKVI